jgi:acyl-CoA thioester hydrolase
MGFVHHSNYICYYEEARSDLMRAMGLSYADMERRGIIMPILDVQSTYHRSAYFDDELTVRIILKDPPTARIRFEYEVYNSQGELINTGSTTLGFLHADTHRPTRAPRWFVEAIESLNHA